MGDKLVMKGYVFGLFSRGRDSSFYIGNDLVLATSLSTQLERFVFEHIGGDFEVSKRRFKITIEEVE